MRHPTDISGQKFGRLTAIKQICVNKSGKLIWLFNCDCGNQKEIVANNVKNGGTKSCGCIRKNYPNRTTHGGKKTKLYNLFMSIKGRCNNINAKPYKDYGGRGIKLCDEWNSFVVFRNWALENGYADNLSIDRINNDGNYEPSNCRWATRSIQNRNKRNNVYIKINEEVKTLGGNTKEI